MKDPGQAWKRVSPYFRTGQDTASIHIRSSATSRMVSDDLKIIIPAACNSRVDTLFVNVEDQTWGKYHREDEHLEIAREDPRQDDEELLNLVAIECLLRGGNVYGVRSEEMPLPSPLAALFHYERK